MFKQIKGVLLIFSVVLLLCLAYGFLTNAKDEGDALELGKTVFKNCSGCHFKGQNLIKEDKPIIGSEMLKKKDIFKEFISNPHPPMPNFKKIAENPEKLDALYKYVTSLMTEK